MKSWMRIGLIGLIWLAGIGLLPRIVTACGGFFCTNTPIDQSAERIIFAVDEATNTITAVVGINYTGEAADFSWVVPVPSPPELDVAETNSLNLLDAGTALQFTEPTNYCDGLLTLYGEFGGGGDGDYFEQNSVGPYDYVIIRNENPGQMVGWLRENGYRVTDEMIPVITQYVNEGMYFLAMKLSQDADVGDIQPVVMTYKSEHPMIPIRLTAVAAVDDMPIITWIFGNSQYVPENYTHPTPEYSRFRNSSQIISFDFFNDIQPFTLNTREQSRIQQEYNGLAFITELAQPSADLAPALQDDPLIGRLIEQHPYVTRLRGQMSPEQMTLDPTFIPAPDAADVSNQIDLVNYIDPLDYWGCSTESLPMSEAENLLPDFTYIQELNLNVGHPADWVLSQFTMNDNLIWAMAAEPVNAEMVNAYFNGEATPPMLIWMHADSYGSPYLESLVREFQVRLGLPDNAEVYEPEDAVVVPNTATMIGREPERLSLQMRDDLYFNYRESGVLYALLANEQQWAENKTLFTAMLDYLQQYTFFANPYLRYTLFIGGNHNNDTQPAYIGYPEGWKAAWQDGTATVLPTDSPAIWGKLIPYQTFNPEAEVGDGATEALQAAVVAFYGLDAEQVQQIAEAANGVEKNWISTDTLRFRQNGRSGYIRLIGDYAVEVSAPEDDFLNIDQTLRQIIESAARPDCWMCG